MRSFRLTLFVVAIGLLVSCKGNNSSSNSETKEGAKTEAPADTTKSHTTYVCPMHPEEKSDQPGVCSICGMDLEAQS